MLLCSLLGFSIAAVDDDTDADDAEDDVDEDDDCVPWIWEGSAFTNFFDDKI